MSCGFFIICETSATQRRGRSGRQQKNDISSEILNSACRRGFTQEISKTAEFSIKKTVFPARVPI
jgi:hypothetical protein